MFGMLLLPPNPIIFAFPIIFGIPSSFKEVLVPRLLFCGSFPIPKALATTRLFFKFDLELCNVKPSDDLPMGRKLSITYKRALSSTLSAVMLYMCLVTAFHLLETHG